MNRCFQRDLAVSHSVFMLNPDIDNLRFIIFVINSDEARVLTEHVTLIFQIFSPSIYTCLCARLRFVQERNPNTKLNVEPKWNTCYLTPGVKKRKSNFRYKATSLYASADARCWCQKCGLNWSAPWGSVRKTVAPSLQWLSLVPFRRRNSKLFPLDKT